MPIFPTTPIQQSIQTSIRWVATTGEKSSRRDCPRSIRLCRPILGWISTALLVSLLCLTGCVPLYGRLSAAQRTPVRLLTLPQGLPERVCEKPLVRAASVRKPMGVAALITQLSSYRTLRGNNWKQRRDWGVFATGRFGVIMLPSCQVHQHLRGREGALHVSRIR